MWPDVPFRRSDNGWTWPGVILQLWSLAPRLAPWDIISNANVLYADGAFAGYGDILENGRALLGLVEFARGDLQDQVGPTNR